MSSDTQIDERLEGCVVHRAGDAEHGEQAAEADPVLTEVIRHGLNSAANQMKRALVRTAFSPIIYEVKDFSSVLDTVTKRAPLRRNTDPTEVADAAVFLASSLGRGVTGNILFVDSGLQIMGL